MWKTSSPGTQERGAPRTPPQQMWSWSSAHCVMLDGEEGRQGACWLDAKGNKGLLFRSVWRGGTVSPKTEGVGTGLPGDKRCGQGPAIVAAAGWTLGARGKSHCAWPDLKPLFSSPLHLPMAGKAQLAQVKAWLWFLPQPRPAILRLHPQLP